MTQFYEDFSSATLEAIPAEFSFPWGGGSAAVKAGNPLSTSGQHLRIEPSIGNFAREALKWGVGDTSGKTTIRARMLITYFSSSTNWIVGPILSASGSDISARTGYADWQTSGRVRIRRYDNGVGATLADVTDTIAETTIDVQVELIRNAGLLEARAWLSSGSRPPTPTASTTDTSPLPVSGWFGLSILSADSSPSAIELYEIAAGTNGDPAPTGPVTGGTDSLTANDISSLSSVSSPAIGQAHALTANDVSSLSSVTSPALGQSHSLTATDVQSTSEVSSPALATQANTDNLSADDISSTSSTSSPSLGQVHNLAANDATSNTETGTPTLQQTHALTSVDVSSLSTVSSPALTSVAGQDSLAANDVQATSTVSSPTLGQVHNLTADDLNANSEISRPAIGQVHTLTANDLASATQVSTPTIRNASQVLVTPIKNTRATVSQTTYKAAIIQPVYKAEAG